MSRKKRSSALFVTNNTNSQNSGNNVSVSNSILNVSEKTSELTADIEGITRMDRMILVDQKLLLFLIVVAELLEYCPAYHYGLMIQAVCVGMLPTRMYLQLTIPRHLIDSSG